MKIVIDIPEERYEFIKGLDNTCYDIHAAIAQGIPLPKGHGDLISREELEDAIDELFKHGGYDTGLVMNTINNVPTVIPTDK